MVSEKEMVLLGEAITTKDINNIKDMAAHLKRLNASDGSNGQALMVIVGLLE